MSRPILIAVLAAPLLAFAAHAFAEEKPVDPYTVSNANAGATPLTETQTFAAFHGKPGLQRIVIDLVQHSVDDPRTRDIFREIDRERLERTLVEQLCYVLNGGCDYTGRDMAAAHKDMGLTTADMGALVENLQRAMDKEGVPFAAQNRLLAKLAPMKRTVVER
ncbi:MAG: group 1 truncated hemoglobin [Caulobacterales bacterium]|nr:group 1 truncated hemoglobin [Caulobacterales bacterium]